MMLRPYEDRGSAVADFRQARTQADLKQLLAKITGESTQLLSYNEVIEQLKMQGSSDRGLQDIPLDAIVGSVGRYSDFTRDFLPRHDASMDRWAAVKIAASGLAGLPPIDVYQIGETYFVKDGNHRVSVARQLGATYIQAYVTEVQTRVPLTPDVAPDDLILIAEYASFLEKTRLDEQRPEANLKVTVPGKYQTLLEHIAVHRYYMGLDFKRNISFHEAAAHWFDVVYMPIVEIIRAQGILHYFPERTETDLYLWISIHRAQLEKQLGWQINTEYAASDLVEHYSPTRKKVLSRMGNMLFSLIVPEKLEDGPPVGQWRKKVQATGTSERLFSNLLVPIPGTASGWSALEQALLVAKNEEAQIYGLHVVANEKERDDPSVLEVQDEFKLRCAAAGIHGEIALATGDIATQICMRANVSDLVVINLAHPPAEQALARLSSGFRDLVQRCPRPILATPQKIVAINRALLAYDGSPKAREALYVAAYLAKHWQLPLVVLTVEDNEQTDKNTLEQAQTYLESRHVQATYLLESGPTTETIVKVCDENNCNLLIMGGYGQKPVLEVVLGGTVDDLLRNSPYPMLICR